MVATGQLGHHAAVLGVQGDLAEQGMGKQATARLLRVPAQKGDARFVTGRFHT